MSATDGDASHMAADPAPPVPRLQNTKRTGPRSFLQDELLLGCTFHDLNDPASVDATILGAGVDGHVWRVRFGDDETDYALKVFWANRRLEYDHCLGVQHESHNNALLQMIEAAVHETADAPAERRRAQEAEEGKEGKESKVGTPESTPDGEENDKYTEVRTVPPFTRCYGWLPFSGQEILKMPQCVRSSPFHTRKLPFRELTTDGEYIALVYESPASSYS
ncbi:hypothetical protein SCUCBS95973_002278 [Sporothrix curviconia]|uniref:Protein kinase domain-containing protein n=1 Tax=Sporothrix curviconia TaxID=1260050 RepID=A0ABP0B5W1_9PEZI